MDPSSRLALLGTFFLFAPAPSWACSNGPPGHVHLFANAPAGAPAAQLEMGRCSGGPDLTTDVAAAAPSPPASLRASRVAKKTLDALKAAGYRVDTASDRLLAPGGAVVTARRLETLLAPVDASKQTINSLLWIPLQAGGYRLDEATCRLAHPVEGPFLAHQLEFELERLRRGVEYSAMETLKAGLRGLPPNAPIPPELIARLRNMEGAHVRLPEALRQRLFAPDAAPTVASLSGPLEAAYVDVTRYFDGRGLLENLSSALAPGVPGSTPARAPSTVSSDERALGELLSREFQANFESNAAGREMLAHFRQPDGAVRLPPILVLKMSQRPDDPNQPGAIYDHEMRQVIFNHWTLAQPLLELVPPAERAQRAKEFSDAAALRRYLAANPDVRKRLADSWDFLILHEFVHYRQGDRSRVFDEQRRNNITHSPLSLEHEAHRQECRYFLARVTADPSLLAKGYGFNRQEYCPSLLADPSILENYVTDLYVKTFAGNQRLSDLAALQDARRDTAWSRLLSRDASLGERIDQGLKLLGMRHGDAALKDEQRRISADRAAFDRAMEPLRAEAPALLAALVRDGHALPALRFLNSAGWAGRETAARAVIEQAARVVAARDARTNRDERIRSFGLINAMSQTLGMGALSPELVRGFVADMNSLIVGHQTRAETLPVPQAEALRKEIASWIAASDQWSRLLETATAPPDMPPLPRRRGP